MLRAGAKGVLAGLIVYLAMMVLVNMPGLWTYQALPEICPGVMAVLMGLAVGIGSLPVRSEPESPEENE